MFSPLFSLSSTMRGAALSLLALLAASALPGARCAGAGNPPEVSLSAVEGAGIVDVWAAVNFTQRCGFIDVPDIPARAFVTRDNVTRMIVGAHSSCTGRRARRVGGGGGATEGEPS